jgi:hypothetical protein
MAQQLNDKDWLEKITVAYRAYPYPNKDIESFITWIYQQYGIVQPKDKE